MYCKEQRPRHFVAPLKTVLLVGMAWLWLAPLSGCSVFKPYQAPLTQGNVITDESLQLIQEGLHQTQIRKLFGPPMGANAFNPNHWEYLFFTSDPNANVDSPKHLVMNFDEQGFLTQFEIKQRQVELKSKGGFFGLF
ncbi:MAG: outer membrane protein assembly factor BamE [Thiotrichales bacterium]|nr:outer membrane protein assembly factor BamE [Thiotrichales bacterium]